MKSSVYVETTIPSAHATTRSDPSSLHRKEKTREWWREQLEMYEPCVSELVLLELGQGDWPGKQDAVKLVETLARLPLDAEVIAVAKRYVAEKLVPVDVAGDAVHLAVACVHEIDFLLTWNIRHLANPNKLDHLTVINRRLGLLTPRIVTPEMLWKE